MWFSSVAIYTIIECEGVIMDKKEFYSQLPIIKEAEVVVVGGGLAGCAAAIAAARQGAKTLLVESGGCLGGAATAGLVAPISSIYTKTSREKFGGILWEVINSVVEKAQIYCNSTHSPASSLHLYKYVLIEKLVESGAELFFHAFLTDVVSDEDGKIKEIIVSTKDGLKRISGEVFVDTTGDGDVMGKSAAKTIIGSEPDVLGVISQNEDLKGGARGTEFLPNDYVGQLQPVSLMMQFGNVDVERAQKYMNKKITYEQLGITKEEFLKWRYANTLGFEVTDDEYVPMPQGRVWLVHAQRNDVATVNMSRVIGVNACDPISYSDAEIKAGLQLIALIDFLKTFVPGFENAYFMESSNTLGIRESRRLIGDYVLSGDEVVNCVQFEDTVAHGSYIIDIHDPTGKRMAIGGKIEKEYYSIPYRSLITKKVPNLGTAGRSISADHVATSSTRIQGTAMLTGEAVGIAAAMAVDEKCAMCEIDVKKLQQKLIEGGVFLNPLMK